MNPYQMKTPYSNYQNIPQYIYPSNKSNSINQNYPNFNVQNSYLTVKQVPEIHQMKYVILNHEKENISINRDSNLAQD